MPVCTRCNSLRCPQNVSVKFQLKENCAFTARASPRTQQNRRNSIWGFFHRTHFCILCCFSIIYYVIKSTLIYIALFTDYFKAASQQKQENIATKFVSRRK